MANENDQYKHLQYAYIVGIGRSGTTLLTKLMNQHRNCLVSPLEIVLIIFFHHAFSKKKYFGPTDYALIRDFFRYNLKMNPSFSKFTDPDRLYEDLCSQNFSSYEALTKYIHLQFNFIHKPEEDLEYLLDKNPSYTLHAAKLRHFTRNVKFIYMLRDYRANVLSRKQSVGFRTPNVAFNAYRWLYYNKKALKSMQKYPQEFYQLKYEDLVSDTTTKLNEVYAFLGISTVQEAQHYYAETVRQNILHIAAEFSDLNQRNNKIFSEISKPVFTDRIDAWQTQLTPSEIRICEAICGKLGAKLGYSLTQKLSAMNKLYYRIRYIFPFLKASYDYYREFILYYFSPAIKTRRVNQLLKHKKYRV